ncbi:MAG: hypothetical protein B6U87_01945 [Candidatus Aenigmarchaeota archaeon ex4484_52]|nr:MAG: hypothetical protein B6U87_01945 [Candidatus Aenigmarchaeota archaeon ex4484_52]
MLLTYFIIDIYDYHIAEKTMKTKKIINITRIIVSLLILINFLKNTSKIFYEIFLLLFLFIFAFLLFFIKSPTKTKQKIIN